MTTNFCTGILSAVPVHLAWARFKLPMVRKFAVKHVTLIYTADYFCIKCYAQWYPWDYKPVKIFILWHHLVLAEEFSDFMLYLNMP